MSAQPVAECQPWCAPNNHSWAFKCASIRRCASCAPCSHAGPAREPARSMQQRVAPSNDDAAASNAPAHRPTSSTLAPLVIVFTIHEERHADTGITVPITRERGPSIGLRNEQ
eukprot:5690882-Prymnesium_polylepis.1